MSTRSILSTIVVVALTVLGVHLAFGERSVTAQEPAAPAQEVVRTVSVAGTGTISAVPDKATIQLGVRTQGETAAEAMDQNNEQMTALLAALRRASIASRDIQTSDFSIWPQYDTSPNGTSTVTGYEVSNRVTITVRDLANLGTTLDAAVRAGGNQVDGIQFGFTDSTALLDEAREAAMADAERKASQLAGLAGVQLSTVVSIAESGAVPPPMPVLARAEMAADMASVPVETGETAVNVTVQVTYQLTSE